jgi:hypothetical protein
MELSAMLLLIEQFSSALPEIEALYTKIQGDFAPEDQATIERALQGKKDAAEASIEKLEADVQ